MRTRYDLHTYERLEDLPNVGPKIAADLRRVGIRTPEQLRGESAFDLYTKLNRRTKTIHDPCELDVFMAAIDFVCGGHERPWWHYTPLRKRLHKK